MKGKRIKKGVENSSEIFALKKKTRKEGN